MRKLIGMVAGGLLFAAASAAPGAAGMGGAPIVNGAVEQKMLVATETDGGFPPVVGVGNFEVFHATRSVEGPLDGVGGRGWTYNHHVDMAIWKGKFYLAWTNGEKDEDVWPAHEVFATSEDGVHWSKPGELFPQGVSTSLRMYWFHAPNGRMLTVAGLRTGTEKLQEAAKGGVVVREVLGDGGLGPVFTLIGPPGGAGRAMVQKPEYRAASD